MYKYFFLITSALMALPAMFAKDIISTNLEEYRITFTPDGKTAYFARSEKFFPLSRQAAIYVTHLEDGKWSSPTVASFSGRYSDMDPFVTKDDKHLYFSSIRPVNGQERKDLDIWVMERESDGWSKPENCGEQINSASDELYPSIDSHDNLYYASDRAGKDGGWDIYVSKCIISLVKSPWKLGPNINTKYWEFNPEISAAGDFLIFTSLNRPDSAGFGDLYFSELKNNEWTSAKALPPGINTKDDEYHPTLSPDGRLLFIRRQPVNPTRGGDFYQIPWSAVRPKN
jgi:hypothetical protein